MDFILLLFCSIYVNECFVIKKWKEVELTKLVDWG